MCVKKNFTICTSTKYYHGNYIKEKRGHKTAKTTDISVCALKASLCTARLSVQLKKKK